MVPSIVELSTYPLELNTTLNLSSISTKISFFLPCLLKDKDIGLLTLEAGVVLDTVVSCCQTKVGNKTECCTREGKPVKAFYSGNLLSVLSMQVGSPLQVHCAHTSLAAPSMLPERIHNPAEDRQKTENSEDLSLLA